MTTLKPVLAVDCDDVLLEFMWALFQFLNQRLGRNYTYEELTSYNLADFLFLSEEEKQEHVEEFYRSSVFDDLLPIEGAAEAMRELMLMCRLVVVTSRHPEHEPKTLANLGRHYPSVFSETHHLGHYDRKLRPEEKLSKGLICQRIGAIGCIEDGPGNAHEIAKHGVPVILPDRPWNRGEFPPLVKRVHSWQEIVTTVRELTTK